jgi:hypothetical protein
MSDEEPDEESHEGGGSEEELHEDGGDVDAKVEEADSGAIIGADDGSSDEEDAPPPKVSFIQQWRNKLKGATQPATTYGPPYLQGMPKIDQSLIDECDMVIDTLSFCWVVLFSQR